MKPKPLVGLKRLITPTNSPRMDSSGRDLFFAGPPPLPSSFVAKPPPMPPLMPPPMPIMPIICCCCCIIIICCCCIMLMPPMPPMPPMPGMGMQAPMPPMPPPMPLMPLPLMPPPPQVMAAMVPPGETSWRSKACGLLWLLSTTAKLTSCPLWNMPSCLLCTDTSFPKTAFSSGQEMKPKAPLCAATALMVPRLRLSVRAFAGA
mmetsp:Transcript_80290/g.227382  ORF Transcript_80290/g.227382 Transcript_80290/m.227382 type:complete len:204 (-) Transcript_80290:245-856(-)